MGRRALLDPASATLVLLLMLLQLPLSLGQYYVVQSSDQGNSNHRDLRTIVDRTKIAQEMENRICNNASYHKMMSPDTQNNTPVMVNVSLYIQSFGTIEESNEEYSMIIILWRWWVDPRVTFTSDTVDYVDLPEECVDCLWRPGVVFENEKSSSRHDVTKSNVMLRIYKDGVVQLSIRISITLGCQMSLGIFPWDTQTCPMIITSGSYTTRDVMLKWLGSQNTTTNDHISIPHFLLTHIVWDNCTRQYNASKVMETLSCLSAAFTFKRNPTFFMIQLIFPIAFVVMALFLSRVPNAMVRLGICVTLVIAMSSQCISAHSTIPKVFSILGIDIFMQVCFGIILIVFVVCIIVVSVRYKLDNKNIVSAALQEAGTIMQQTATVLQTAANLRLANATLQHAASSLQCVITFQQEVTMLKRSEIILQQMKDQERRREIINTAETIRTRALEMERNATILLEQQPPPTVPLEDTDQIHPPLIVPLEDTDQIHPPPTVPLEDTVQSNPPPTVPLEHAVQSHAPPTVPLEHTDQSHPPPTVPLEHTDQSHPPPTVPLEDTVQSHPPPTVPLEHAVQIHPPPTVPLEHADQIHPPPTVPLEHADQSHPPPTVPLEHAVQIQPLANLRKKCSDWRQSKTQNKEIKRLDDKAKALQLSAAMRLHQAATNLQPANAATPQRTAVLRHAVTTLEQAAEVLLHAATLSKDEITIKTLRHATTTLKHENTGLKEALITLQQ